VLDVAYAAPPELTDVPPPPKVFDQQPPLPVLLPALAVPGRMGLATAARGATTVRFLEGSEGRLSLMTLGIRRALRATYDEALARLPDALASEGFGVLTRIDIQSTLKRKLGVDFRRYEILGACNPPLAHEALQAELAIGLMLPCNVIVYEDDAGHAVVMAVDPTQTMAGTGNAKLAELAEAVKEKLSRALSKLD
jgi:uncharacterized protein (DUF302 family)